MTDWNALLQDLPNAMVTERWPVLSAMAGTAPHYRPRKPVLYGQIVGRILRAEANELLEDAAAKGRSDAAAKTKEDARHSAKTPPVFPVVKVPRTKSSDPEGKTKTRSCIICSGPFTSRRIKQVSCSTKCAAVFREQMRQAKLEARRLEANELQADAAAKAKGDSLRSLSNLLSWQETPELPSRITQALAATKENVSQLAEAGKAAAVEADKQPSGKNEGWWDGPTTCLKCGDDESRHQLGQCPGPPYPGYPKISRWNPPAPKRVPEPEPETQQSDSADQEKTCTDQEKI